jgi:Cytochrome B561
MRLRNDESRYGLVAQIFHWAIVVLIVIQFVLASKADALPRGPAKIAVLEQHKSVGITILALVILRLAWRWMNPVPPQPLSVARWQRVAAQILHIALYSLLLIVPVLGWFMSSARNFPVSWFRMFTLPDFIAPNETAFKVLRAVHVTLARTLAVLALLHIAAALKHHFIDRDDVLRRMLPLKLKGE